MRAQRPTSITIRVDCYRFIRMDNKSLLDRSCVRQKLSANIDLVHLLFKVIRADRTVEAVQFEHHSLADVVAGERMTNY